MKLHPCMKSSIISLLIALILAPVYHIPEAKACATVSDNHCCESIPNHSCCESTEGSTEAQCSYGHCCSEQMPHRGDEPFTAQQQTNHTNHELRGAPVSLARITSSPPKAISTLFTATHLPRIATHVSSTVLRV